MIRLLALLFGSASFVLGQSIREATLDPLQAVDLPVSREITTVVFPGAISAVAGSDVLLETGKGNIEVDEGAPLRFQITHAQGANFILIRSLQPNSSARLTAIYEGAAYVLELRTVQADSTASLIFRKPVSNTAKRVDGPPEAVKFSSRIGLSLLDRARAFPILSKTVPKSVEGVTLRAQNRTVTLPDLEITVQEVYRFSKEDAGVVLLHLNNTSASTLDLAPSTFAARVAQEKFEQSIANGPRVLGPGEGSDAEFAVVGLPDGTRNDLSADNAFTILINASKRAEAPAVALNTMPNTEAAR